MAQEKEDYSPSPNNNSDEEDNIVTSENNAVKPDLGFENVNFAGSSGDQDGNRLEKKSSNNRKEESSLSFKHFLRRDLSLPNTSINNYEGTGAKPKIYSNSVHPSLGKLNIQPEEGASGGGSSSNNSNNNNNNRKDNLSNSKYQDFVKKFFNENTSPRTPTSNDVLGMPSLPDFVQDHLLLEQTYLGTDAPLSVDLDNLPDFTFNSNSNYNCTNSPNWSGNRKVYEPCDVSTIGGPSLRLALDLTETVDRHHQQPNSNHLSFPLDLPPQHASQCPGGESLQLPDFLPAHAGDEPARVEEDNEREQNHNDVETERRLRQNAQRELRASQQEIASLRREVVATRSALLRAQTNNRESAARSVNTSPEEGAMSRDPDDSLVASLRSQIDQLRIDLRSSRQEVDDLRNSRRSVARSLIHATHSAESSLRDLLSGLEQVRGLANTMDSP